MGFEALRRRWVAVPDWAKDASLVTIAALLTVYRISAGSLQPTDRPPDRWAYVLGLVMAVALLARRRWPAVVLAVITVLWLATTSSTTRRRTGCAGLGRAVLGRRAPSVGGRWWWPRS